MNEREVPLPQAPPHLKSPELQGSGVPQAQCPFSLFSHTLLNRKLGISLQRPNSPEASQAVAEPAFFCIVAESCVFMTV